MPAVAVQIQRFVSDDQPGFIECSLIDAFGKQHLFVDKAPVLTTEDLSASSSYPRPTAIACEAEREWVDDKGRKLVQINTELPWHVASTVGATRFIVLSAQVQE